MSTKMPWSTTPTVLFSALAAARTSLMLVLKDRSTMKLPLSVTAGLSPSGLLLEQSPVRSTARHPATSGRAATVLTVWRWQKGVISTGSGKLGPRPAHSLELSTMQMNLSDITSTIFSRRRAPPPPLISDRPGSTASAPSMATSSFERSLSVQSGIPRPSACSRVFSLVGMQITSVSSPDLSFCPTRSTAKKAVEPVPSPTTIPERTWSSTALYPAAFLASADIAAAEGSCASLGSRERLMAKLPRT
mmetsp:Transcript_14363/g.34751  ORF Transcript_14363/g.34751 Transcript_14363/m.34751 type:complete len:247 (-) Transcript_14363:17-757(-)